MSAAALRSVGIDTPPSNTQGRQPVPPTDIGPPASEPKPENPGAQSDSPKQPETVPPTMMDQNTVFWEAYNKAGDVEDKEFVGTSGKDLDSLLIFAGLFSAINTSFITESYPNLTANHAEKGNKLLQCLISVHKKLPDAACDSKLSAVDPQDIIANCCFFASLCCSLSAAFGAVLAQQWLTQYDRDGGGSLKSPADRGRERQQKSEGRQTWHLENVIVTLPTLLQFSLFFFFIGLVSFMWPVSRSVTTIIFAFTVATFIFYAASIIIAIVNKTAPFQTRLSLLLHSPGRRLLTFLVKLVTRRPSKINASVGPNVDVACFTYLFERMVGPERVSVFADAIECLWDSLDKDVITTRFIDTYLKPTIGPIYILPYLPDHHRLPLLKILAVLVKEWRNAKTETIKTPMYPLLSTAQLFSAIPSVLQQAFVADPADTESLQRVVTIMFTIHDLGHSPSSWRYHDTDAMALWLHEDVTKNLKHEDSLIQRNTLRLLACIATSSSSGAQTLLWDAVHKASSSSQGLRRLTQMDSLKGLLNGLPTHDASSESRVSRTLYLFNVISLEEPPEDLGKLAGILETLPLDEAHGPEAVVMEVRRFLSRVVEVLVVTHLKPELDCWWQLPGLRGKDKQLILGIIHVIVVEWNYLEADLEPCSPSHQLLHPLFSSLRAELWGYFLASLEDSEGSKDRRMISAICRNLPNLESLGDDEITAAARRKVGSEMSGLLQAYEQDDMKAKDITEMLCSNPDLWLTSTFAFKATPPSIPVFLRSTMWNRGTADLEDFWRATCRVQLLPAFFPDELRALRFPEYLHLWHERYHLAEGYGGSRRLVMNWAYLLSLQRMLSAAEAPELAEELKEHDHQSDLLAIFDEDVHDTCPLLALSLFLRLWSHDTSDMRERDAWVVVYGLKRVELSLTKIASDFRVYAQSSRVGDLSDEQWGEEISDQVMRDMGQMVKWLYSYLEAAVHGRLIGVEPSLWDDELVNYGRWCSELDEQLGMDEYGQLARRLRDLTSRPHMTETEEVES